MARKVRCVMMRGGTSKAVFLKEGDLPRSDAERDALARPTSARSTASAAPTR